MHGVSDSVLEALARALHLDERPGNACGPASDTCWTGLGRYGHLYPEADRALRDRLDRHHEAAGDE